MNRTPPDHSRGILFLSLLAAGLGLPPATNGAEGSLGPHPEDDPATASVLQPGIVEEVTGTSYWFDFDQRSPLQAGLVVEGYYDDNVFLNRPGLELDDYVLELIPLIEFESSRPEDRRRYYLRFGYDPQILRFLDFSGNDADNHRAFTQYRLNTGKLRGGFDHRSAQFSGTQPESEDALFDPSVDADLGRRTEGTRHFTRAFAELELSGRTLLELAGTRTEQDFATPGVVSNVEYWGEAYLRRRLSPKTEVGLGSKVGRFDSDGRADTDYVDALGLIRWKASPKVELDLEGGVDTREITGETGIANSLTSPIFNAQLRWMPREFTTLSVDAFHQIRNSVNSQSVERTGILGSLRQRLLGRFTYSLQGGYQTSKFDFLDLGLVADREDDYLFIQQGLEFPLGDRSRVGVFHEFRKNDSNRSFGMFDFDRNQLGIRITINR